MEIILVGGTTSKVRDSRSLPIRILTIISTEIASLDWHKISIDDALQRLSVSPRVGLDSAQVQRRAQMYGKNVVSPPKRHLLRKVLEWLFGGFGTLLLAAAIVCFVAWYIISDLPLNSLILTLKQETSR